MKTRIIALIVAAVLAIGGGLVLVNYVRTADARAFNGAELTDVLVVASAVPAGTPSSALDNAIVVRQVPTAYVVDGAVTSIDALVGLIAAVELQPGEQVLASRFVTADQFGENSGSIPVPAGLQEISIAVDAQRVVGGQVVPGDEVGIFTSFEETSDDPASTRLMLSGVLVTSVATAAGVEDSGSTGGLVLVGLAVSADDAQKLVYSIEFGRLWVSKQDDASKPAKDGAIERDGIPG